jgi:hypothetical protein
MNTGFVPFLPKEDLISQPLVFISYAQEDEEEKEALFTHLGTLQREGLIRTWSNDQISAGADWKDSTHQAISQAKVAVLLITANFLNSDFIIENEIPALLSRQEAGELTIFPVIVRACAWKTISWLQKMKVHPNDGHPIRSSHGGYVDEQLATIVEEIFQIITQLMNQPLPSPTHSQTITHHPPSAPPNPFGDRGRITSPDRFFDRKDLMRQIFEELNKGANLSLVGDSQIGKSSILSMICHYGPDYLATPPDKITYLSLEWVDDEEDFYEALCEALEIESCRGFKLTRACRDKKYLLCLDEMEKMTWDGFTVRLRSHLRGLADGCDSPLTLVIASRSPLAHLFPDSPEMDSPLAGICRQINVKPFPPDIARDFLHHRLSGTGVTFTEQQINELLNESQGHPAHLQQAAAALYTQLTRHPVGRSYEFPYRN